MADHHHANLKSCVNAAHLYPSLGQYLGDFDSSWKPISLTFILYPEGDLIGKILAWSSLLPIFIIVSFLTLILFRRELHTMVFFLGILINEAVNMALKYSLKAPRPCAPGERGGKYYNKYGMPSSHAQFMAFFAVYMVFFAYIRLKMHTYENFMDNIRKHLIASSSLASAIVVSYSRVYLHYHTLEQVAVGVVAGLLLGATWFYVVEAFFTPLFQVIVNTKLAEYFLIRDSSNIPDILWFEYTTCRTEARQRQRRIAQKSQ